MIKPFSFYKVKLPLLFCLGALMPLSFAPFYLWYLTPFVLAAWLIVAEGASARQQGLAGFVFALGMFCVGLWWVRISVHQFGGAPLVLAIMMVFLLSFYLSLYYALLGYVLGRFKSNVGLKYGVVFPLVGVMLEVLRAHLFTGFPWFALGYTLVDSFAAAFILPVMGALMASFWVYLGAGLIVLVVGGFVKNKPVNMVWRLIPGVFLACLTAAAVSFGYFFVNEKIENFEAPVPIALLQGNIAQDEKFNYKTFWDSVGAYLDLTTESTEAHDIIIWPETAIASYFSDQQKLLAELREWSQKDAVDIMFGMPRDHKAANFNSVVFLGKTARTDQFYDKYRLLPFGEYIPLRAILGGIYQWINIPLTDFTKGARTQAPFTFSSTKAKATASICFEAVFGDSLRYQARQSQFLINISNDAWFGDSLAPWQHLQIVRARSIELGRPIVRSTNTGVTAFIDEHGHVRAQAPLFTRVALKGTVQPTMGLTAYAQFGDLVWIGFFMVLLLTSAGYGYWSRNSVVFV